MLRLKTYLNYIALPFCVLTSSFSFAHSSTGDLGWRFKASSDVPLEQQEILRQDIAAFVKMPFVVSDDTFNKVMGIKGDVKAKDLAQWLSLRIQYLIGESYEMSERDSYVAHSAYSFQYPGILPDIPKTLSLAADPADPNQKQMMKIMSNTGAALYLNGKLNGMLIGINMPGLGKIPATSPRVGILQVGQGLFRMGRTKNNTAELDSSLMRISTLFHEARHSDGNRKNVGFMHIICPAEHEYAGYAACDFSLNGSYSVGFQVGKAVAENCTTCTVAQREALRLDYLDSYSRVILKQEVAGAPDEEIENLHRLKGTCKMLLSYGAHNPKVLAMCEGLDARMLKAETKQLVEAQYLDATPEGKL